MGSATENVYSDVCADVVLHMLIEINFGFNLLSDILLTIKFTSLYFYPFVTMLQMK